MADPSPAEITDYDLVQACKKASPKAINLMVEIVDKSLISVNQGGGNLKLIGIGVRAAQTLVAYGYGQPTAKIEHSGEIKASTIDPAKMSTEALREMIAARRAAIPARATEVPSTEVPPTEEEANS